MKVFSYRKPNPEMKLSKGFFNSAGYSCYSKETLPQTYCEYCTMSWRSSLNSYSTGRCNLLNIKIYNGVCWVYKEQGNLICTKRYKQSLGLKIRFKK